jgi:hypothetical protein
MIFHARYGRESAALALANLAQSDPDGGMCSSFGSPTKESLKAQPEFHYTNRG